MHGRATVAISGGDEPEDWSFTGSATSAVLLNHIATNANNKGFGVDDDNGDIVQYVTVWHCAKNSAGSHGTTPTTAATTARSSSRTTKTATQRKPWSIHRALPHVQRHDAARHHAPAALRRVDIGRVALPWKVTDFDKDAGGDFNDIVARTLMAAAEGQASRTSRTRQRRRRWRLSSSWGSSCQRTYFTLEPFRQGGAPPVDRQRDEVGNAVKPHRDARRKLWQGALYHHPEFELAKWSGAAPTRTRTSVHCCGF